MSIGTIVTKSFPLNLIVVAVSSCRLSTMVAAIGLALAVPAQEAVSAGLKKQPVGNLQGPVVGVIDVSKVIDQYPRHIKLRAELDARFDQYQDQLQQQVQQLETLRVTVQGMGANVPERAEAEHQYKIALQTQDFRRKYFNDLLAAEELRMMLEVYEDLDFAVSKVAKKVGVSMVVIKRDIPRSPVAIAEMSEREVQARVNAFQSRTVWYASKELEITGDVIKYLMVPLPSRTSPERAVAQPVPASGDSGNTGTGKGQ